MRSIKLGEALLFCPGDRPDRFLKAVQRADRAILDLEDAVGPARKAHARQEVITALPALDERTIVRINATGTTWQDDDIAALRQLRSETATSPLIMLPKAVSGEQLAALEDFDVIALCETAEGVLSAAQIAAAPNCVALFWGGEDLIADLGGRHSRDASGHYYPLVEQARSTVLLAAAARGIPAIDAVHIDITDYAGLKREAKQAVDLGFRAKACIHPSHLAVIREAFRPSDDEYQWARDVVEALKKAQNGVVSLNGRMIDDPLLKQAQMILGMEQS